MRRTLHYLWFALVAIVLLKTIVWLVMPLLPWLVVLAAVIIIIGSLVQRRLPF